MHELPVLNLELKEGHWPDTSTNDAMDTYSS